MDEADEQPNQYADHGGWHITTGGRFRESEPDSYASGGEEGQGGSTDTGLSQLMLGAP